MNRVSFDPKGSYSRMMAEGHWMRTGHKLVGYYEPIPGDEYGTVRLVRTCCAIEGDGK